MVGPNRRCCTLTAVSAAMLLLPATAGVQAGGEICGTIQTKAGETLRGPIRWDRNEVFWDDLLNATRQEPVEQDEEKREFSMTIFGLRLGGERPKFTYHSLAIPFGHLRSVEPLSGREARLSLKSGADMVVSSGSTDIGAGMRELIVDDPEKGEVTLGWNDIQRVEFAEGTGSGRDAERLYGTVTTEEGAEIEGYLVFDNDAALVGDTLTGDPGRTRGDHLKSLIDDTRLRELRIGDFSSMEPTGDSKMRGRLRRDQAVVELSALRGIGHNTVTVSPAGVGAVEIDWEDIRRIDFAMPPASPRYEAFDGGRRLSGTVHTRAGKSWSGKIVWDRDETHTYDALDGEIGDDLEYHIPFANIATIKRKSSRSSEVVLTNGSSLELEGTNDVDDDNRGIVVHMADGSKRELEWEDTDRVEFDQPTRPVPAPTPTPADGDTRN